MEVNVHEAKTHLSRLLKRVTAGEEVTISRAGVPVARLIAVMAQGGSRPMGMDRGKIWVADDFDRLDPEMEALFYAEIPGVSSPGKRDQESSAASTKKRKKKA
jgi:prevent-host-death family protein